jgi:hypothetical protein
MFPITYKNRFIYKVQDHPSWTANRLREYFAQSLIREEARNVVTDGKQIRFGGRIWRNDLRWHSVYGITNGKITVDYRDVQVGLVYQISFTGYFVAFLVMMGLWILWLFVGVKLPLSSGIMAFVVAFFWLGLLMGAGIAVSYYRFNRFIKDRLREFFNSTSEWGAHGELITSR